MWQTASDFLVFLGWAWQNSTLILKKIFLPVQYIYTFLKEFFVNAFQPPIPSENIWTFDSQILGLFNAIPYFNVLISALVLGIIVLMIVFILKTFLKT